MTDAIAWEWTHVERPCRCAPEHRPFCHRCGGTGIVKLARLRRVDRAIDALMAEPCQEG